ncbi:MAG: sigma-54 dependent transcriptional regulator [Syntrophobacteraceae bacterium]|jgi:DNA-binding NtrC family response regulator|nr:sigma-54 dependent transcriptional regulator [Syntrophobacteraceae bacterium]
MASRILIIDDEADMLLLLRRMLSDRSRYEVTATDSPLSLPDLLRGSTFDLVLTDLKMPQRDGIQILAEVKAHDESIAVVIMTAYGTIESAIDATRKGAFDYITKPFRKERILQVVEQALKWRGLQQENLLLREKLEGRSRFPTLIGSSPAMKALHLQIDRVARTSATVLITGESGTGKELVARAVHSHGSRGSKPFIPINCGTIPEPMIESELFGHVRGSFTGALRDKKGLVEEAHHGTLFLDETGDLSLPMQVKLLRLLQEGEYKVVGANTIRKVDIRFIAATNHDLQDRIRKGEFREDLFYRLNVFNIHLTPLRERAEDIPALARHFLHKYCVLHKKEVSRFSSQVMAHLMEQEWPGNVRQLENTIERGVIMATGEELQMADILTMAPEARTPCPTSPMEAAEEIFQLPFKEAKDRLIEEFETQYLTKVLARHAGNVSQAARDSGVKRQYLHRLMRDNKLDSRSFRKGEPEDDSP